MFDECSDLRFRYTNIECKGTEINLSFTCCHQFYKRQANCEDMATSRRGATLRSKKYGVRVFGGTSNNGHFVKLFRDLIASSFHGLLYAEINGV